MEMIAHVFKARHILKPCIESLSLVNNDENLLNKILSLFLLKILKKNTSFISNVSET
jgi:hypothetical protein